MTGEGNALNLCRCVLLSILNMMFVFLKMHVKLLQYGYKTIWTNILRQMKLLGLLSTCDLPCVKQST